LKSANPGDAVIVESGTYNLAGTVSLTRSGTAEAPIYLLSAEKDGVIFKGSRGWSFNGNHWVISGFIFQSWKERLGLNGNNIRFSGNKFRQSGAPLTIFGSDSEISENIWTGSTSLSIIAAQSGITCTKCKFPKGTHIHHNTFKDIPRLKTNGGEAMMLGYGYEPIPPSYDDGLELLIENNLFENAKGDREVISFKSSNNTVRNNCFLNNGWGGLVIRMGNDNVITGNQFIGLETTGVRISGSGNVLRKNYFEGKKNNTYSAITFHNRSLNSDAKYDPWGIYKYDAADNNIIEDNQFYSFKNLIRDYSFVGESLKHSEGTEVSGNEFYITSSSLYNLQAGRSKAEILDAHTIVDNEMLSEAPTSRSSCR
jgi:poly(beta-D-mannuronate) lyase